MLDLHPGTGSSNPFPSSKESANYRFRDRRPAGIRQKSTVGSSKSSSLPTPARTSSPLPISPRSAATLSQSKTDRLIAAAIKPGFTIYLSANNPPQADSAAEPRIAPAVLVDTYGNGSTILRTILPRVIDGGSRARGRN
jgi:hypothetical protein